MFEETREHPSFAQMSISRVQCSHKQNLYGSSIKHNEVIILKIKPSYTSRNLNRDWYFSKGMPYIEVAMSQSQFAQAITSLNQGEGTPVTLTYFNGQKIETCPFEDKRQVFNNEFTQDMKKLNEQIKKTTAKVEEMIETKKTFNKADKEEILNTLGALSNCLTDHMPFMASQFTEQMEKTVTEAKAEVEAFVQSKIQQLGIEKANELKTIE